ncbi:hypothetical protein JOD55_000282 [Arcanobacterium pluranimalium]|uniref:hypothetical protein n=1 Tax=Arcanobacterium pluranimalium TaxID=108028 RepID=UPI00195DA67A|nr:hypothetical protein [Arcanobacterium pluranimalium]MBM7824455.1 hypothetical protein [Arcanobacterium pluranimalium]
MKIKENIPIFDEEFKTGASFTPGKSYLVLAEVFLGTDEALWESDTRYHHYEIMDDVDGDPNDTFAFPTAVSPNLFEIVDDSRPNWVTKTFDYGTGEPWTYSGDARYVKANENWGFLERMVDGELPDLALLRMIYPPSTWHSDCEDIDDSIKTWIETYLRESASVFKPYVR